MMYREFLESGIRFFPLWQIDEGGQCGCGLKDCEAAGKHPRISNWGSTPEWGEDQIEAMEESGQLDTGYGVVVSGLLVVDVDERNGGADSYAKLLEKVPSVAGSGFIVRTGSGGQSKHLYFRLPEEAPLVQHLDGYDGLDFKSTGYVVGPGSLHRSGNRYEVLSGDPSEIDDAPEELVEMLRKPDRHRATVNGQYVDVSVDEVRDMLSAVDPDTIMSVIDSFLVFDQIYIMTGGGPVGSTETLGLLLYRHAFSYFDLGSASAVGWVMFVLMAGISLMQWRMSGRGAQGVGL